MVKNGFNINGKLIDFKAVLEQRLTISTTDLNYASYELQIKGSERQRVRPAAQILSNTVSQALKDWGEHGILQVERSIK